VVSVDPSTHSVAMVSFPRDIAQFQMYNGATYNGKINSLMSYAKAHPTQFPDGPLPTLVRELSFLLGTPIHYYAAIDIDGFRRIIDAVGGVDVNVQRAIQDARYDWLDGSPLGFFLSAGKHHMDGRLALAYVRSRYGVGDNDFTRAARQQQLLVALRQKLTNPAMLTKLPDILKVAGDTIRTNFPADRVDEMVALARGVDEAAIQRFVLQPPTYSIHPPTNSTGGTYILRLHMDALANLSLQLFGQDSSYWYPGVSMPPGAP
jgi:LCP family protein required for cell wall assembly